MVKRVKFQFRRKLARHSLGSFPYEPPKRGVPVHTTVAVEMRPDITLHVCPDCSYGSLVRWSKTPFVRRVLHRGSATDPRTVHVDRRSPLLTWTEGGIWIRKDLYEDVQTELAEED